MAKKAPAKKAPAKRKPRAKTPADDGLSEEFGKITPHDMARILDSLRTPAADSAKSIAWRSWLVGGAKAAALIVCGAVAGVYAAGGLPIGPGPSPSPSDAVSLAFDQYETLWRAIQLETAKKLEAGEFTTSQQVTQYRSLADGEALKKSRQPLVDAEFAAFGGEKWTADKAAKHFRSYAE
jgi:hypothetical protein